jgi:hypothetical protein
MLKRRGPYRLLMEPIAMSTTLWNWKEPSCGTRAIPLEAFTVVEGDRGYGVGGKG